MSGTVTLGVAFRLSTGIVITPPSEFFYGVGLASIVVLALWRLEDSLDCKYLVLSAPGIL